jgi:hypothetical protein
MPVVTQPHLGEGPAPTVAGSVRFWQVERPPSAADPRSTRARVVPAKANGSPASSRRTPTTTIRAVRSGRGRRSNPGTPPGCLGTGGGPSPAPEPRSYPPVASSIPASGGAVPVGGPAAPPGAGSSGSRGGSDRSVRFRSGLRAAGGAPVSGSTGPTDDGRVASTIESRRSATSTSWRTLRASWMTVWAARIWTCGLAWPNNPVRVSQADTIPWWSWPEAVSRAARRTSAIRSRTAGCFFRR